MCTVVAVIVLGPAAFNVMSAVAHKYCSMVPEFGALDSYRFWISLAVFLFWCRLALLTPSTGKRGNQR